MESRKNKPKFYIKKNIMFIDMFKEITKEIIFPLSYSDHIVFCS